MKKNKWINKINEIETYASTSKFNRFVKNPFKYTFSIFYSKFFYRYTNISINIKAKTIWGQNFILKFPSAIDIYLSGGKTHNSEIRLAKFLVLNLLKNSNFIDIGAHFGYYSLLANKIVSKGKILSIEASPHTFEILEQNVYKENNILPFNIAIADKNEILEFCVFPTLYSEYNTLEKKQYENEDWFKNSKMSITKVQCKKGDTFLTENLIKPNFIKIDVEGAEDKVIIGFRETLTTYSPIVIMEFCNSIRGNSSHIIADNELKKLGYNAYFINSSGEIQIINTETKNYVDSLKIESDNIVYKKNI
jgi:FkbM family methyltransferase